MFFCCNLYLKGALNNIKILDYFNKSIQKIDILYENKNEGYRQDYIFEKKNVHTKKKNHI